MFCFMIENYMILIFWTLNTKDFIKMQYIKNEKS